MTTRLTLGWRVRALCLSSLLALWVCAPAAAQTSTAMVRGSVRDAQGAPVPAAVITATDTATGYKRSAVAGANGFYVLPGLRPSTYQSSPTPSKASPAPSPAFSPACAGQSPTHPKRRTSLASPPMRPSCPPIS